MPKLKRGARNQKGGAAPRYDALARALISSAMTSNHGTLNLEFPCSATTLIMHNYHDYKGTPRAITSSEVGTLFFYHPL